jgi:hypothetical protein
MQKNIVLDAEQTIYQARQTHSMFVDALKDASELTVALDAITDVDSSFLQNLLWLKTEGARLNIQVNLHNPPPLLQDVVTQLGLVNAFNFGGAL